MKKLLFRADGNAETGLGHLYRMFALIEMLKHTFDCEFITRKSTVVSIIPATYKYHLIPDEIILQQETEWLKINFPPAECTLILDGYQFDPSYQKELKTAHYELVYVDDLVSGHQYADIVINHSSGIRSSDYVCEPYTKLALGTSYAIIRPLFLEAAKRSRKSQRPDTAFVCFGGADPLNLSYMAACALLNLKEFKKVHVVIGGAYKHQGIAELEKQDLRLKIHRNLSETELVEIMEASNFGVVSSSTILYETCTVKMPVFSGYYVENQKNIYKGLLDKGAIFGGGNLENYSVKDFEGKLDEILQEKDFQKYYEIQGKIFDAEIADRFVSLIAKITIRRVEEKDMLLLFDWANDKITRLNSFNSNKITLEDHKKWFEKKLKDSDCFIYIAEADGIPAGMVRYETGNEITVVGISVAEEFRGKRLAGIFLKESAGHYFRECAKPVMAYIKKQNTSSIRSFEKAGYKLSGNELVNGFESVVYKLENKNVQ